MKIKHLLAATIAVVSINSQALPTKADVETEAAIYKTAALLADCIKQALGTEQEKACAKRFLRFPQMKRDSYATWDYSVLGAYYLTESNKCWEYTELSRSETASILGQFNATIMDSLSKLCFIEAKHDVLRFAAYVDSPAYDLLAAKLPE